MQIGIAKGDYKMSLVRFKHEEFEKILGRINKKVGCKLCVSFDGSTYELRTEKNRVIYYTTLENLRIALEAMDMLIDQGL